MSSPLLPGPPRADRRPIDRIHHGDVFADPYEWLRDADDPDVRGYLEAENAWTEAQTAHLAPLTEAIFGEISARTKQTDLSVPAYATHDDGTAYWYYSRTVEGSEYRIHCRVAAPDRSVRPDPDRPVPGEQILLDGNAEAAGSDFFSLGSFAVSPSGRLLAYAVDRTGAERFTLRILDLTSGDLLADTIDDTAYGVAWAGDDQLFYTRPDHAWRPHLVLRHRVGTDSAADAEVFNEPDERFWLGVDASRDRHWIVISAGSKITSECYLLRTDDPEGTPRSVAPRRTGVEYEVEPAGDRLLVVHNDGASDFELAQAPLTATSHTQWRPVLAQQPGVRIVGVSGYAGHAVVSLRRDGLTGVHVLPRAESGDLLAGADIAFDEPLFTVEAPGEHDFDTPSIQLAYSSLLTPDTVFSYDLATGERTVLKRTPVLDDPTWGAYDPGRFIAERAWATAPDGTRVPLSIVRRRDVPRDGSAPAVLYGYGSYEHSIDPAFSIPRLSLLDRGIVYAIAHVRGGGELGRSWYEQGRLGSKTNTFTDFVACADHLIAQRWTSVDRLAARGASAGGLLMGAVANLAPDRFAAIHAGVPFVDNLTTILDPDLPLTVVEWDEWGDPLHDADVYAYLKSYSPYENVSAQTYPAILATTSLNDTRVSYVEPAKWVAALRHTASAGSGQLLLKTELVAGHGGVSGRYQAWRELGFEFAWIVDQITR